MADCAQMETASSHFIPELVGACISTAIVAVGMFFSTGEWHWQLFGSSGFISYCRLFGKSSEKSESEADGIKNGMCGRDSGVPGKCKRSSCI